MTLSKITLGASAACVFACFFAAPASAAFVNDGVCWSLSNQNQVCVINEPRYFDMLAPEPVVQVPSFFPADLQIGFVALSEPGSSAKGAGADSDFLVFPDSGNGFAGAIYLVSYDVFGNLPSGYVANLASNTLTTPWGDLPYLGITKNECGPEGIVDCPVIFQLPEGTNLQYTDTFIVYSDTPEPLTIALFGAGLAGLGALRRRRQTV